MSDRHTFVLCDICRLFGCFSSGGEVGWGAGCSGIEFLLPIGFSGYRFQAVCVRIDFYLGKSCEEMGQVAVHGSRHLLVRLMLRVIVVVEACFVSPRIGSRFGTLKLEIEAFGRWGLLLSRWAL